MGQSSHRLPFRAAKPFFVARALSSLSISAALLLSFTAIGGGAHAGTLKVLYSFCTSRNADSVCTDGSDPEAGLVRDSHGNLYGTTAGGGANNYGTVFEIAGGKHTILYNFCRIANCPDGAIPQAGLVMDASGNLYGTTQDGGSEQSGILFELLRRNGGWTERVLHNFCSLPSCADGGNMVAGITFDKAGNIFGTTESGGDGTYAPAGAVYEMTLNKTTGKWSESVLYKFCSKAGCVDGDGPQSTVILDSHGNLFGTAENGGKHQSGVVFELSKNAKTGKWEEKILHHFCSNVTTANPCYDGASPLAALAMDADGNLFGNTVGGGVGDPGYGVAFKLTFNPATGSFSYSVIHRFCQNNKGNCNDGVYSHAPFILDKSGNLYGTTTSTVYGRSEFDGGGTIFKMTSGGTVTHLHFFCDTQCPNGKNDGASPAAPLIMDSSANLYGTASGGGRNNAGGEVFELMP